MSNPHQASASVLRNYVNEYGNNLQVFQISLWRPILAELNTHKILCRSMRSSRAVPANKLLEEVRTNPAMPVKWFKNQPGMQAEEEMNEVDGLNTEKLWRKAATQTVELVEEMVKSTNPHKGIVNRLLEPFLYSHGVLSGTEWENFYNLRLKQTTGGAQLEFVVLAQALADARANSEPELLKFGQWCLPYITPENLEQIKLLEGEKDYRTCAVMISAARVARNSYKQYDGSTDYSKDFWLANSLIKNGHWAPFEPVAMPDTKMHGKWVNPHLHGQFTGFIQARRILECYGFNGLDNYVSNFDRGYN